MDWWHRMEEVEARSANSRAGLETSRVAATRTAMKGRRSAEPLMRRESRIRCLAASLPAARKGIASCHLSRVE